MPDAHEALVGHPEHGAPARFDVVDRPQLDVAAAAELLQRLAHAGAAHRLEVHPVAVVADDERLALLVRERRAGTTGNMNSTCTLRFSRRNASRCSTELTSRKSASRAASIHSCRDCLGSDSPTRMFGFASRASLIAWS